MQTLILSLNVILPLVTMVAIGYLLHRYDLLSDSTIKQMNDLTFKIFIPCLLFKNIVTSDVRTAFQPKLILFCIASMLVFILISVLYAKNFEDDPTKRGVIAQASFRSNFIVFGVPIVSSIYGADNIAVTSIIIAIIVPFNNVMSILVLQYFQKGNFSITSTLKALLKNPMIIASILGFTVLLLQIPMPTVVSKVVFDMSAIASPLALLLLGGTFKASAISENVKQLTAIVFFKLIFFSALGLTVAVQLGYSGIELVSLLILFGAPPAVASFSTAVSMGGDEDLASQAVLVASVCSVFTMFMWFVILGYFNLV